MTAHPITDKTLKEWGLRTPEGVVSHARDEKQARDWLAYDHRHHIGGGEVLVARHHGQDWHVVEDPTTTAPKG
jgi:hypothetical protein